MDNEGEIGISRFPLFFWNFPGGFLILFHSQICVVDIFRDICFDIFIHILGIFSDFISYFIREGNDLCAAIFNCSNSLSNSLI